jgi:DNA-nicking Smr family endonuclease
MSAALDPDEADSAGSSPTPDEVVPLPITGDLDLHTFQPAQVKDVVLDYLDACRERGVLCVRIVHGKGIGHLRRTVHAVLARHPEVESFALAGEALGGWGATLVRLRPRA